MINKCAVYIRKSTEHGLDQEFNSLQNQEESCRAYIASQAFNNWEYYKSYTDAAISGGTMERPALKQMLDDITQGLINTVVVYKVDRLSRSILDFHNMMKFFDKYGVNFVSITQAFDTNTSMGKLTLNMLLSFAQFEREVASERIRDKVRASKAKGYWMGGLPPLGYDTVDKKLVVNQTEAAQVKELFEKYVELQSVATLIRYANEHNILSKRWVTKAKRIIGGIPFGKFTLHKILRNKIYIGKIENKVTGQIYDGEHEAIISQELWNRVQESLANNSNNKQVAKQTPNVLYGKLFRYDGQKFKNQSSGGKKVPHFYYATKGFYLPSKTVDKLAIETITEFLHADLAILPDAYANTLKRINVDAMSYNIKAELLQDLLHKVIYSQNQLVFELHTDTGGLLQKFITENYINQNHNSTDFCVNDNKITIVKSIISRKYLATKFNRGETGVISISDNNRLIVKAFATAWQYRTEYEKTGVIEPIAKRAHATHRTIYKYLGIAYMNPKIVNQILGGKIQINLDFLLNTMSKEQDFDRQNLLLQMK